MAKWSPTTLIQSRLDNFLTQVFADWPKQLSRFVLTVLGIAAGVFCVGALLGMLDIQGSQMDKAHLASQPAHIVLILRTSAPYAVLPMLKETHGIADIATQSQTTVRYRQPGDILWSLATVLTRPDYRQQPYERITLHQGNWPEKNKLAVEVMTSSHFAIPLNTGLQFQTRDGIRDLKITGIVRHPFTKPPRMGGQPMFMASLDTGKLFGLEPYQFNQVLVRSQNPDDLEQTRGIAAELRLKLAKLGYNVSVTLLQDPYKHWGHVFFAGVNKVLLAMALASLVLASMLILNSVAAHLFEQTVQIAIMKSIGASTRLVFTLYLIEIIPLALLALVIAIPASVATAHVGSSWMLSLFNIVPSGLLISECALVTMAVCGIGMTVVAAMPPVFKAVTQPIRKGLDTKGLGSDFGINLFDALMERYVLQHLPTLLASAIANLFKNKARFVWIQGSLVTAGVIFLVVLSLRASVNQTLDNELQRTRYSARIGLLADYPRENLAELAKAHPATLNIEYWRRLPIEIQGQGGTAIKQKGSLGLQLLALPAATLLYKPYIVAGRWLEPADAGRKALVISQDTADLNQIKVGDEVKATVAAQQESWQIVGTYRWLAGANFVIEPAYAALETVEAFVPKKNMASFVVTSAAITDLEQERDYLRALQDRFWDNGFIPDIYSTSAKLDQREHAKQQLLPVTGMLFGLASMVAVIAGIALAGALTLNVLQRKREIAVLRAIGASNRSIFGLFMTEGILHGILSWLGSAVLAFACARPASAFLGQIMFGINLEYCFDSLAVTYWLAGALLISVLASWWPARLAMKLSVKPGLE